MNTKNYLNNGCATFPQQPTDYLTYSNYLSEFSSELDKQKARDSLGITFLINQLKDLIDSAVISSGGVVFDTEPTEGHTYQVLSSDVIYRTLLKYITKEQLDAAINELYLLLQDRINDLNSLLIDQDRGLYNEYEQRISELEQEFTSVLEQRGVPFTDKLGNSNIIGISQKALTYFITLLYNKMADLNGEPLWGITLDVAPDYFISEGSGTATIKVNSPTTITTLKIWANDVLVVDTQNVQTYQASFIMNDTTLVRMEATMLNLQFIKEMTITKYYPFFIGSGKTWQDAVTDETAQTLKNNSVKGFYPVTVQNDNDKIFIIIPTSKRNEVGQIEMSGFQMQVDEATIDNKYVVFSSQDSYQSGHFQVEIV